MRIILAILVIGVFGILAALPEQTFGQAPATSALRVPGPAPTAEELSARMNGLSLPTGFQHVAHPPSPIGEVAGLITGPGNLELAYSILPPADSVQTQDDAHFSSDAERLKRGKHQWYREQYIGDELVQMGLSVSNFLVVSFPGRGINLNGRVNDLGQLADALVVTLSITNRMRRISWEEAKKLIENGDVVSVTQFHSGQVVIRMADEGEYRTQEPQIDDVIKLINALGKSDKIGIATE